MGSRSGRTKVLSINFFRDAFRNWFMGDKASIVRLACSKLARSVLMELMDDYLSVAREFSFKSCYSMWTTSANFQNLPTLSKNGWRWLYLHDEGTKQCLNNFSILRADRICAVQYLKVQEFYREYDGRALSMIKLVSFLSQTQRRKSSIIIWWERILLISND